MHNNIIEQFKDEIRKHGLKPPEAIEPGKFHRFPGLEKPSSNRAAYCKLFEDCKDGVFGDFSSGLFGEWHIKKSSTISNPYIIKKGKKTCLI